MITKITASNIKGLTFEEKISKHTLFLGKNGSGKSVRSQALLLAILGYIPGNKKTARDIMNTFGTGKELKVGVEIDSTVFGRKFLQKETGTVSQYFGINGQRANKDGWMSSLGAAGCPKILNLSAFMDLSDQKKIDHLFELFPPDGDVKKIVSDIERLDDKLKALNQKIKTSEGAAARLQMNKIELPSGSLAETTNEIEKVTAELKLAKESLKKQELKLARAEAKEKAEREAAEKSKAEAEVKKKVEIDELKRNPPKEITVTKETGVALKEESFLPPDPLPAKENPQPVQSIDRSYPHDPSPSFLSIQKIIKAMDSAGCEFCAAKMVAMKELKKYQAKGAA